MSLSLSNRAASLPRSQSKSQQLAKAVADTQSSPVQSQFRPDSLWSEGGADVVWNGNGHGGGRVPTDGFVSPPLPSPAGRSTRTQLSSNTDSSLPDFADADEGNSSDEVSWEADTTMTTLSNSDSQRAAKGLPGFSHQKISAPILQPAPPARPKRMAPLRPAQPSSTAASRQVDDEDGEGAASTYGHAHNSSVGSSIWAGRGAKQGEVQRPPVPPLHPLQSHAPPRRGARDARDVQSVTSSVYSQSPALDWEEDSPQVPSMAGTFPSSPRTEPREDDDEFEMMTPAGNTDGQRRLADGTLIPKMPPVPLDPAGFAPTRGRKGRQNRSPILSYADGAEEEERLVEEREFREHGGIQGLEASSRMGPTVKKNSPAPWEMADGEENDEGLARSSYEGWGMPSSQLSNEQLQPPNIKHASSWARQSMESFRNRNTSNGSHQPPSSKGSVGFPSRESVTSPTNSSHDGGSGMAIAPPVMPVESAATSRRSRSKSVSSSAAGMLKGLGLAPSATPATKKTGKFGKALRGMGAGVRSSSSTSGGAGGSGELKKGQGISSDDYAHLPPSPIVPEALGGEARMTKSASNGTIMSASGATINARRSGGPKAVPQPLAIQTTDRVSSSNDSHAGTSASASSANTAGTSPGLSPKKPDLTDLLLASNSKYRDQSFVPSPQKGARQPQTGVQGSSPIGPPRMASMTYKHSSTFASDGSTAVSPTKVTAAPRAESATPTALSTEEDGAKTRRSGGEVDSPAASTSLEQSSRLPSLGSVEGSTPYKLISLQEARQQQQQDQQQRPSLGGGRLDRSTSNKTLDQLVNEESQQSKSLKNKKSGFLRMFAKDRSDNGEPMPLPVDQNSSLLDTRQSEDDDVISSLPPTSKHSLAAPALSLRPMSSMFNGFAPGMLEEQKDVEGGNKNNGNMQLSPMVQANGRLAAPHSPAITVHSIDGNSSRASSQIAYEDALDLPSTPSLAPPSSTQHLQTQRTDARKNKFDAVSSPSNLAPSRKSSESVRSDSSSALGLVTGFPATPGLQLDGTMSQSVAALASETRSKALEIEGKIAELVAELVKLRTTAVENGLVSHQQVLAAAGAHGAGLGMHQGNASNPSLQIAPASPTLLNNPISPCSQCGCQCAEQKRVQTLNEMAILKGVSVLDRGRALKSLTGGGAAKFGSYINR